MDKLMDKFVTLIWLVSFQLHAAVNQPHCLEVPVKLSTLNIPIITLTVNQQPIDFVLDLGKQPALTLEKELIPKLLTPGDTVHQSQQGDLGNKTYTVDYYRIDSININNQIFRHIVLDIFKPWGVWINTHPSTHLMPNNTIGRDLFLKNNGILYLSLQQQQVIWCHNIHALPITQKQITWQPLEVDQEGIHVSIQHHNKPLDFVIDSAATVSLIKPEMATASANQPAPILRTLSDLSISNRTFATEVYPYTFPKGFQSDGLLGNTFFRDIDLIIDTIHQRIGFVFSTDKL